MAYVNNNPMVHIDPTGHIGTTPAPVPTQEQCQASNYYAPGCGRNAPAPTFQMPDSYTVEAPPPILGPSPTPSFDDLQATAEALPNPTLPSDNPVISNGNRGEYMYSSTYVGDPKTYSGKYLEGDNIVTMALDYQATVKL
jgi:hypothetical protein